MDKGDKLIERISRISEISKEEIIEKVDAKKKKLSGLISQEGAAQIVAAEMGVILGEERVKIEELDSNMRKAHVVGKITKLYPIREYNKNGREGKIGSFQLGDETSNIRTVLWDSHHIDLLENETLKEGEVVEISNAGVRNGELHLSGFSDIKKSNEKLGEVKTEKETEEVNLKDVEVGQKVKLRAVIVQAFEPRSFESKDDGKKKGILNVVLDDGTETIRGVLFGEQINKLGLTDEEIFSVEKFNEKKLEILGNENYFFGNIRNNDYFGKKEMIINGVQEVDPEKLLEELKNKKIS
jgi:replication factor A1